MKNTLLAAAVAAALTTTASQSPAADSPADQLEIVTTAMNSLPEVLKAHRTTPQLECHHFASRSC
jgi:hypothetical protein